MKKVAASAMLVGLVSAEIEGKLRGLKDLGVLCKIYKSYIQAFVEGEIYTLLCT